LVSLGHSLRKYAGILGVEQEVDTCQLHIFIGQVPVTAVDTSLLVVGVNEDWLPLGGVVFVPEETFGGNRSEGAFEVIS
jgi:hypothetical protein